MQNSKNKVFFKVRKDYILRAIAGENILVPVGGGIANFSGVIYLNDTAAFLWKQLQSQTTREELVQALEKEFDVSFGKAQEDIEQFVCTLSEHNMLEVDDGFTISD